MNTSSSSASVIAPLDAAHTQSANLLEGNLAQLKTIFPEAFKEGGVDFEVLKQLLGGQVDEREEKYGLNWHGKRRARQIALTPSTGTLRPCPGESVDWDTTQNLMIEGDNLEVLKLLQKSYAGKVKMIYIDPPYNTGKDFVYPDNFTDNIKNYLELTGQTDGEGRKLSSNTEASGRFHTDWLNMMYPRLKLARNLLREDGVIFISIDEREYSSLRLVCCDVFGEENIVGTIIWKNATDNNPTNIATEHEYILVAAKSREHTEKEWKSSVSSVKDVLAGIANDLISKFTGESLQKAYDIWFREHRSELGSLDRYKYIDRDGIYTGSQSVHNPGKEGYRYNVMHPITGKACKEPLMGYRFPKTTMDELLSNGRIIFGEDESKLIELKVYASEYKENLSSLLNLDGRLGAYDLKEDFPIEGKVFTNPKPVRLFETLLPFLLKQEGDLVLDFFAGSGSCGKAVWQLNLSNNISRKFILVQLPELLDESDADQKAALKLCDHLGLPRVLSEITKERLRRAATKIRAAHANSVDSNSQLSLETEPQVPRQPLDLGFKVFKLDTSNIRAWNPNPDELADTLMAHTEHLATGRTEADVLYEVLLKQGLDLAVPVQRQVITGHTVHSVGAGALLVCLAWDGDEKGAMSESSVTAANAEALALGIADWHTQLAAALGQTPAELHTRVVLRDSLFDGDVAKTNLTAILRQRGLEDVRSL